MAFGSGFPRIAFVFFLLALGIQSCALLRPETRVLVSEDALDRAPAESHPDSKTLREFVGALSPQVPSPLLEPPGNRSESWKVRWNSQRSLASVSTRKVLCRERGAAHGLAELNGADGTISLHPALKAVLEQGQDNPQPLPCSAHLSAYRLAQAAVVHQLAHAYYEKIIAPRGNQPWQKKGIRKAPEWVKADEQRSPEPIEGMSEEERFASNLEFLSLDPEFACRRPFEARWIAREMNDDRLRDRVSACSPRWTVETEEGVPVSLQPSLVQEIRYVYVDRGKSRLPSGGHAMFVIRTDSGEYALSLRANVFDPVSHALSGLTGVQQARLYVYPFEKVREEYGAIELKDLVSAPLQLSLEEKEAFLALALERYWAGGGTYVVGRSGSAVEIRNFLREALGSAGGSRALYAALPDVLLRNLEEIQRVTNSTVTRIPSERSKLEAAFTRVNEVSPGRWGTLDEFLERGTSEERKLWSENALQAIRAQGKPELRADLELLEARRQVRLARRSARLAAIQLSDYRRRTPPAKNALSKIWHLRVRENHQRPSERIIDLPGYGIPLDSELSQRSLASTRLPGSVPGADENDSEAKVNEAIHFLEIHRQAVQSELGIRPPAVR